MFAEFGTVPQKKSPMEELRSEEFHVPKTEMVGVPGSIVL
jgi:hypothetical protein